MEEEITTNIKAIYIGHHMYIDVFNVFSGVRPQKTGKPNLINVRRCPRSMVSLS